MHDLEVIGFRTEAVYLRRLSFNNVVGRIVGKLSFRYGRAVNHDHTGLVRDKIRYTHVLI
jgi:hypothetical protein